MPYTIKHIKHPIVKWINLPSSKSISNRILIIQSLCANKINIRNLSKSNDTKYLKKALCFKTNIIDARDGGTTLRFLMAYLCSLEGDWKLFGSKDLMSRPIDSLVVALRKLGANIERGGELWIIKGKKIDGGRLEINASESSQFVSALLLVAPSFKNGLQLTLKGKIVSSSYIDMTMELMREFGVRVSMNGKTISVAPGKYQAKNISIETDWSAASYFYELVALKPGSRILLKGLVDHSLQGDRVVAELYEAFGVKSLFKKNGVLIESENPSDNAIKNMKNNSLIFDIKDCPDLFPALVVTVAAKGCKALFKNTCHLNSKESERAKVYTKLLQQLKCKVIETANTFSINRKGIQRDFKDLKIKTFNDHRIAMSFAPLSVFFSSITFDFEKVVEKSFPGFWKEFEKKNN